MTESSQVGVLAAARQIRTPTGIVLVATAFIGMLQAVHWGPVLLFTVPVYLISLLAPKTARRSGVWFFLAAGGIATTIVRRGHLEDHVYLWVAWTLAVAVSLTDREHFVDQAARQGRYLMGLAFGFATFWKVTSGSFLTGSAFWTLRLHDDRLSPLSRLLRIPDESFVTARQTVDQVALGQVESFDIELSTYSNLALLAVSIGTVLIEGLIAVSYLAPDTSKIARLRVPAIVVFGLLTYSIVPVLQFSALLALMALVVAKFDRRASISLGVMLAVTLVRYITL